MPNSSGHAPVRRSRFLLSIMIPNHADFIQSIQDHKKLVIEYYSSADSGVLSRVCAPMDYGPGFESKDGIHRYWVWDYAGSPGVQILGLVSQQIVSVKVTGEEFDPSQLAGVSTPALTDR
jgi:hypothetical protein